MAGMPSPGSSFCFWRRKITADRYTHRLQISSRTGLEMIFRATFYKTELIKKDLVTFPLPVLRDFDALLTKSRLLSVTQRYLP
jgi:hypothetical protein